MYVLLRGRGGGCGRSCGERRRRWRRARAPLPPWSHQRRQEARIVLVVLGPAAPEVALLLLLLRPRAAPRNIAARGGEEARAAKVVWSARVVEYVQGLRRRFPRLLCRSRKRKRERNRHQIKCDGGVWFYLPRAWGAKKKKKRLDWFPGFCGKGGEKDRHRAPKKHVSQRDDAGRSLFFLSALSLSLLSL